MRPSVLLVDRDPELLIALGFLLEDAGFDSFMASDASEAITVARQRQPRAIVLELEMEGENTDLCRTLREAVEGEAHCVLTTAVAPGNALRERVEPCQATELLDKPVASTSLIGSLRGLLGDG